MKSEESLNAFFFVQQQTFSFLHLTIYPILNALTYVVHSVTNDLIISNV